MELTIRILSGVLAALVVVGFFGLTVLVHELGHFLAARACGMRIDAFSIGFGPAIVKRKRGNTIYKIGWIPFGGYVALPQLDPSGMSTIQGENGEEGALPPASWWKRILVSLAGPIGNIILAVLIAVLISLFPPVDIAPGVDISGAVIGTVDDDSPAQEAGLRIGDQVLVVAGNAVATWDEFSTECHLASGGEAKTVDLLVSNRLDHAMRTVAAPLGKAPDAGFYRVPGIGGLRLCGIGDVLEGMPAALAGLQTNDLIVAFDGKPLYGHAHFIHALQEGAGREATLRVLRGKDLINVTLTPVLGEKEGRWIVGAVVGDADPAVPMWMRFRHPWRQIEGDITAVGRVLRALVAPKQKGEAKRVAQALNGPIVILATMWLNTLANLLYTVGFVRFLNVNLAIINLLPLPVLDGGHIMFAIYEGVTRRKVNPKVLNWLVNAFAVLLLTFFVYISVRDTWLLARIFGKKPAAVENVMPGASTNAVPAAGEGVAPAAAEAP
jgi:regulator of sigma E protease